MAKVVRDKRSWLVALGLAVVAGVVVPLMVLGSSQEQFTATPYADVIRFEAQGVATLQVQIFDLSGRKLWDSGVVSGQVVDWNRTNTWGERLAYGAYLYQAQGWNAEGGLVLSKSGKLALLPGDKVQLQQAPAVTPPETATPPSLDTSTTLQPLAYQYTDLYVSNSLGVGTDAPAYPLDVRGWGLLSTPNTGTKLTIETTAASTALYPGLNIFVYGLGHGLSGFNLARGTKGSPAAVVGSAGVGIFNFRAWDGTAFREVARFVGMTDSAFGAGRYDGVLTFHTGQGSSPAWNNERMRITSTGNVGIGTTSPAGKVDIRNTTNQAALRIEASSGTNLIEAYNTGTGTATGLVFRVERGTGNVRADGAFYGAGFYSGSADVAEHINVSEPVEPGDVVEIDSENPGYFRKARIVGSRLVAGVISTQPGVVLGSNSDPVEGEGDPRPLLALAGRVPVKATTENGPIQVGDLLIASSKPGYAMRASDPASAVGAVIGKALEPLEDGDRFIMIQVTLR